MYIPLHALEVVAELLVIAIVGLVIVAMIPEENTWPRSKKTKKTKKK